jgi:hypothetical protein
LDPTISFEANTDLAVGLGLGGLFIGEMDWRFIKFVRSSTSSSSDEILARTFFGVPAEVDLAISKQNLVTFSISI